MLFQQTCKCDNPSSSLKKIPDVEPGNCHRANVPGCLLFIAFEFVYSHTRLLRTGASPVGEKKSWFSFAPLTTTCGGRQRLMHMVFIWWLDEPDEASAFLELCTYNQERTVTKPAPASGLSWRQMRLWCWTWGPQAPCRELATGLVY